MDTTRHADAVHDACPVVPFQDALRQALLPQEVVPKNYAAEVDMRRSLANILALQWKKGLKSLSLCVQRTTCMSHRSQALNQKVKIKPRGLNHLDRIVVNQMNPWVLGRNSKRSMDMTRVVAKKAATSTKKTTNKRKGRTKRASFHWHIFAFVSESSSCSFLECCLLAKLEMRSIWECFVQGLWRCDCCGPNLKSSYLRILCSNLAALWPLCFLESWKSNYLKTIGLSWTLYHLLRINVPYSRAPLFMLCVHTLNTFGSSTGCE